MAAVTDFDTTVERFENQVLCCNDSWNSIK